MTRLFLILTVLFSAAGAWQDQHDHPAPEKLGTVSFPISCKPGTQQDFNRAVALLHSFAYADAEKGFQNVAAQDPHCAIAYWGAAMTHFHQLWEPALPPSGIPIGQHEIRTAEALNTASPRERGFIHALSPVFNDASAVPYRVRLTNYVAAMHQLAAANASDVEAQIFYALALLSAASPLDKEHANQKQAADLLEPLYREFPDHPGISHYLIHACDNQELASRGLPAARAYSRIAPSAPHALHMPSHIYTRLGMWDDSIESNLAARDAAHQQGDIGEELHAMDYLVYAYLQEGRDKDAAQTVQELRARQDLKIGDFKSGYAATAMPVRYAVERHQWNEAQRIADPAGATPQVLAVSVWARGIGFARGGSSQKADKESETLSQTEQRLRASGEEYWANQASILRREIMAWSAQDRNKPDEAVAILRRAADDEDGIEKLPVTPGPILPAREQLGELLLEQGNTNGAAEAFAVSLMNAPGRRGSLQGAAQAAHRVAGE